MTNKPNACLKVTNTSTGTELTKSVNVRLTSVGTLIITIEGRSIQYRSKGHSGFTLRGRRPHPNVIGFTVPWSLPWPSGSDIHCDSSLFTGETLTLTLSGKVLERVTERACQIRSKESQWAEEGRRRRMRADWVEPTRNEMAQMHTSIIHLRFDTLQEVLESVTKLWEKKELLKLREKESFQRWPEDLALMCPGDAGAVGELLLGLCEYNDNSNAQEEDEHEEES